MRDQAIRSKRSDLARIDHDKAEKFAELKKVTQELNQITKSRTKTQRELWVLIEENKKATEDDS